MVETTKENFVVLENEYGELPVDSTFLQESNTVLEKDINIWELTEGCICCSVNADFGVSVLTIANTLNPDYLIVEPTGIGMLSNIIRSIRRIEYERIRLLKPITIVDVHCFDSDRAQFGEIYTDQIISTDQIVLSKTEQVDDAQRDYVVNAIRGMNPAASIDFGPYTEKPIEWWFGLLNDQSGRQVLSLARQEESLDLEHVAVRDICMSSMGELVGFLESVIRGVFGSVRRAKGCVQIDGHALRFDVVHDRYGIVGISEKAVFSAVFIGRGLNRELLQEHGRGKG